MCSEKSTRTMIKIAECKEELVNCFDVLSPLRPHLNVSEFISAVERLRSSTGYKLAFLLEGEIKAVAGFRISEWLHTGNYLEIEDLITKEGERSKGYGGELFDWVLEYAKDSQCKQLRLLSGVSREQAHKFYLSKGMKYEAKYFSINV